MVRQPDQMMRRRFLQATMATWIVTVCHGSAIASSQGETRLRSFEARSAMRFTGLPDTSRLGIPKVTVAYTNQLWPKDASKAEPDLDFLRRTAIPKLLRTAPDLIILDVEHWDLSEQSDAQIARNIDRYVLMLRTFREAMPAEMRLGLYSMVPVRNYWAPVRGNASKISTWQKDNQRLQPIADLVDVIFPSLYTFYDDPAGWVTYAKANISEARKYGRPVHAFLWPQYHDSGEYIAADFWRLQLETVFDAADGLVIWTPAKGKPRWNPEASWWLETVAFLESAGLSDGPAQ